MADFVGGICYVDTEEALADLIGCLDGCETLAVDTEFVRERTYYPELCLVQVASGDAVWCVDPIGCGNIGLLFAAFADPGCLKVFHAARQDLEVIFNETGVLPAPLFDTQIAAALLGRPEQIGYAGLVSEFFDLELDKTSSRTDWAQRPLTQRQIKYAAADVQYLGGVKNRLAAELRERGREAWLAEECLRLSDVAHYENDPKSAWQRVKGITSLAPRQLAVAVALAAWRERNAQSRNLPRGWVLKDEKLLTMARAAPRTKTMLSDIEGVSPGFVRRCGAEVLETVAAAMAGEDQFGGAVVGPPKLTKAGKSLARRLLEEVRRCATSNSVAASLIATRREVEMAVCGDTGTRLFEGWRNELLGSRLREHIEQQPKIPLCE